MSNTFVMVPVPEELVHDVVHFVAKLNMQGGPGGSLRPWDAAAMEKYFLEAHEETRTLLSVIARGSLAGKRVTDQAAADFMQLGAPEMLEVMRGIRESLRQDRRVQLIEVEVVSEPLPSGRLREKRLLKMPPELAAHGSRRRAHRAGAGAASTRTASLRHLVDDRHPQLRVGEGRGREEPTLEPVARLREFRYSRTSNGASARRGSRHRRARRSDTPAGRRASKRRPRPGRY